MHVYFGKKLTAAELLSWRGSDLTFSGSLMLKSYCITKILFLRKYHWETNQFTVFAVWLHLVFSLQIFFLHVRTDLLWSQVFLEFALLLRLLGTCCYFFFFFKCRRDYMAYPFYFDYPVTSLDFYFGNSLKEKKCNACFQLLHSNFHVRCLARNIVFCMIRTSY